MILTRNYARCPGVDAVSKSNCPDRERCKHYLVGVEDIEREDAWTNWSNYYQPSDLLVCLDNKSKMVEEQSKEVTE